jgi:hypothetical protein
MWTDLLIIFFWLIFFSREINSLRDSLLFQLDISSVRCLVAGSCSSKSVRPELFHSDKGTNLFVVECKLLLSANCSPSPVLYALKLLKFRGCLLIRNFIFIIILLMHFLFPGKYVIRFNWACNVFSLFSGQAADTGVGLHPSAATSATLDAENVTYVRHFVFRVWAIGTAAATNSLK